MLGFILLFPLIGFLVIGILGGLFGKRLPNSVVATLGCGSILLSLVFSFYAFIQFLQDPTASRELSLTLFDWIPQLGVAISLKLDPLSQLMILVVTGVGFFIHLYSVNYMGEDPGFARYFSFLNLFTFAMLLLVLANNLLLLFIGWEGVGLCSYLLIGFWFEDNEKAQAGKKAFLVNRVGDFGFLMAMFLIFVTFGTFNIDSLKIYEIHEAQLPSLTLITLLLFIGACGKSAQIPLYVWLPDAMAGPTPVSALIHAATMVTAGVYMVARLHFWYALTPFSSSVVAIVGISTALFSASMAFFQNDIKKVLAYSTISQLGYMFLGVGIGAYTSGIFHLITHAFFKALLFLSAGSVIHALHGEQDIQKMGKLSSKLPLTHIVFLFGLLAIIGIPPFSGFFSKDEILWMAFNKHPLFWVCGWLGALMTTFYMVRVFTLTFYGPSHHHAEHPHEAPPLMALSLIVLAILSLGGGMVIGGHFLEQFLTPLFTKHLEVTLSSHTEHTLMIVMILSTLVTAILTFFIFHKKQEWAVHVRLKFLKLHTLLSHKYYVDELYQFLIISPIQKGAHFFWSIIDTLFIDGTVNNIAYLNGYFGSKLSFMQNGNLQRYAFIFILGVLAILLYLGKYV